jgi:N-acetylmuramic acid-specific PTS system IIC component
MAKITRQMIDQIIAAVGGKTNIAKSGNCMTRLRLTLNDNQAADKETIKAISGVMGVVESDSQFQIILGPGKAQTAADLVSLALSDGSDVSETSSATLKDIASANKKELKAKQSSAVHAFLSKFATIFTPLIPGFIAAGLLLGFATLLAPSAGSEAANATLVHLTDYMKIFSKGLFAFLGIMIGYNAQQAFGGSGVNGAIIASLFILGYDHNVATGIYSGMDSFFGLSIVPKGNIIGVLIAAILGAYVEKAIRRIMPDNLDMILTSLVTLLIMGALTFLVIMPLAGVLFNGMSWLFLHLSGNPIGSAVLAGLFLISVMFGIHQGFVPVYFALVETQGFNSLFPILAMAGAGQVGAALALYVRSKKGALLRTQISGAIIPGLLGVGEPLIYGVTLPRVKPFVTACIGGACGGFFVGMIAYLGLPVGLNTVFGPSGLVAIPLMTSDHGALPAILVYVGGILVSYIAGFIATYFFGSKDVDLS